MTSRRRNGTGTVRQLKSGRWQARYPDQHGRRRCAPTLFETAQDARAWLARYADGSVPAPERKRVPTLREYAEEWLATRTVKGQPLKPRTRLEYGRVLDRHILPAFGSQRLDHIATRDVRAWHARLSGTPTVAAHAYSLLRAILRTAEDDELIDRNPCRIRGAGSSQRVSVTTILEPSELHELAERMPARLRVMVLLSGWCGLRFGEVTELRRADIEPDGSRLYVLRAVTRVGGTFVVGSPKGSSLSVRSVAVPPHIRPALVAHLAEHVPDDPGALLFPALTGGGHLGSGNFSRIWRRVRAAVGRPDLRFHDLRHTGATLATLSGASLAQVQQRLGHSTVAAAMRYQHALTAADEEVAVRLSELAMGGKVVQLRQ